MEQEEKNLDALMDNLRETMENCDLAATIVLVITRDGKLIAAGVGDNDVSDINAKLLAASCAEHIAEIGEVYETAKENDQIITDLNKPN